MKRLCFVLFQIVVMICGFNLSSFLFFFANFMAFVIQHTFLRNQVFIFTTISLFSLANKIILGLMAMLIFKIFFFLYLTMFVDNTRTAIALAEIRTLKLRLLFGMNVREGHELVLWIFL